MSGASFQALLGGSKLALGTPVLIGTINTSAAVNTFATSGNILASDLVLIYMNSLANTGLSISDGTNTYTLGNSIASGGGGFQYMYYKTSPTPVTSGATVTLTYTGSNTYSTGFMIRVPNGTAIDANVTASALPASSGTLSTPNEIVFGCSGGYNFTGFTEDAAFTNLSFLNNSGQVSSAVGYKIVSATTAVSYNPTLTGSGGSLRYMVTSVR